MRLNKKEAADLGLKVYFNGNPCKKYGHKSERYVSSGECVACAILRADKQELENAEELEKYRKEYYIKNSEAIRAKVKAHNEKHPEVRRRRVGHPEPTRPHPEDSICELCNFPETYKINGNITKLCLDHDHETGKFRGWLCHSCNLMLGNAKDSVKILEKGIRYLNENTL